MPGGGYFWLKSDLIDKFASLTNSISNKPATRLAIIAGASGLIYLLVFTLRFPLARFYATIPPIDYTKLTNYSLGGLMAYVIGIGVLFELYLQAIRLTAPGDEQKDKPAGKPTTPISSTFVFISSTILAAISIFSYPLTAIDLFIYAIRMRGWALYIFDRNEALAFCLWLEWYPKKASTKDAIDWAKGLSNGLVHLLRRYE